jgi:hypothetical protein
MFRFTIRDLLLLTVIVAMGAGWWLDRQRLQDRVYELIGELAKHEKIMRAESIPMGGSRP